MGFVVVFSTCTMVRDIALSAAVGLLVDQKGLPRANARLGQSKGMAEVAGLLLSGALLTSLDFRWVVTSEVFVLILAAIVSMSAAQQGAVNRVTFRLAENPALRSISEGLKILLWTRRLRELALRQVCWNLCIFMIVAALVPLLTRVLRLTNGQVGWVMAAMSAGTLAGSTIIAHRGFRFSNTKSLSLAACLGALAYLLLPFCDAAGDFAIVLAVALRFVVGLAVSVFFVAVQSARQAETPSHLQGQMAATGRFVSFGAIPLGSLLGGLTSDLLGPGRAIELASIILLTATVALDVRKSLQAGESPA